MSAPLLTSRCPATGERVWTGPVAGPVEVGRAVERARAASAGWRRRSNDERIAVARAYATIVSRCADDLARTIARETGKTLWEARQEVASIAAKIELAVAAQAERAGGRRSPTAFGESTLRHRPHGVMAVLGPYNFPGHLPNGHIAPALIAGNAVVFKPSELTPATGQAMADAWREAGLPDGVLEVVQGGRATGEALVAADIDGLLFTGSATAGRHFRRIFADRPAVILALELGGNNPLVVWDGDVVEAAAIVVQSAFVTTGQRCSCARRLIVPQGAFGDAVADAVVELSDRLRIGPWTERPEPYMGPLVSREAADRARGQVERLAARGARLLRPLDDPRLGGGAFVRPAVVNATGVGAEDEEIFAPVVQIVRVADADAAIAVANDTRYGLSAGLVSEDDGLWERFADEVRAGVVNRNRPTTGASGAAPFGGLGESGNHRPSAYYAADYCAFPTAGFEAATSGGNADALVDRLLA